jgi:hypothetical protein
MNEEATNQEAAEQENTELESTTPEEIAELLHLPTPEKEETEEQEEDEETEESEESEESEEQEESESEEDDESEEEELEESEEEADAPTFELEVEDANGEKFILKPGDDLEKALRDFEPKNNGQIFAVLKQIGELEAQKAQYDSEQAEKAEQADTQQRISDIQKGWDKEIEALRGQKRIELDAKGKSERVDKVFEYMNKENDKRLEDGRPLIHSFEDALDKLELSELREAEAQKAKEEKKLARERGAKVGGSSAPATSGAPVYKGGARTANDAIRAMGLI